MVMKFFHWDCLLHLEEFLSEFLIDENPLLTVDSWLKGTSSNQSFLLAMLVAIFSFTDCFTD